MCAVFSKQWITVLLAAAAVTGAQAQNWTTTKLNTGAVTNELGQVVFYGTPGSYNNDADRTIAAAFDGSATTFFDPPSGSPLGTWGGFELETPKMVTRIRYIGRGEYIGRLDGVLFQGANNAEFTDAVTLHMHDAAAQGSAVQWHDVTLGDTNALQTFKFLRFCAATSVAGGNVAELEFYGTDLPAWGDGPLEPVLTFADIVNWRANLRVTTAFSNLIYQIERKLDCEDDFTPAGSFGFQEAGSHYVWADTFAASCDVTYRIRAVNHTEEKSGWVTVNMTPRNAAIGTWIGTQGSWNNAGGTGEKIFDGDVGTFFDSPVANDSWVGLDLGASKIIAGVNYVPRRDLPGRMATGRFEVADNLEFTGAVQLFEIVGTPPIDVLSRWVAPVPVTARYVRYYSPNASNGNVAEVEFVLAPPVPKPPMNLSLVYSDLTNAYAVLSWVYDTQTLLSSGIVWRAAAPGGPYEAVTPEGLAYPISTWTDTTAGVGMPYYYKVTSAYADGDAVYESALEDSPYVAHRRFERLERSWDDLTQVKAGIGLVGTGDNYSNNSDVHLVFDNSTTSASDKTNRNPRIGVVFPEAKGIARFRFVPRSDQIARLTGAELRGANDASLEPYTALGTFPAGTAHTYSEVAVDCSETFTHVYVTRPDGDAFHGNIAELELYGWGASQIAGLLTAAADVTLANQTDGMRVTWTPGENQTGFRIERQPADGSGDWMSVGAVNAGDTTFVDMGVVAGIAYCYRVTALGSGDAVAYSDSAELIYYAPGSGSGLKGYYYESFTRGYDPNEALMTTQVDPVIDFNLATGVPICGDFPQSTTNVGVVWNGTLTVPLDGTYTFYLTTDDGCAMRIDGAFVINEWWSRSTATSVGELTLAAGEHAIRIDYFQGTGGSVARLEWAGPVTRAVIPTTQLKPLDLPAENLGPWLGGRTFNSVRLGTYAYDPANGNVTIHNTGGDIHSTNEAHTLVWQKAKGPFLLEAKATYDSPTGNGTKALLMMRNRLETGSPFISAAWLSVNQYGCKFRPSEGANIIDSMPDTAWITGAPSPVWLRLSRLRNEITLSVKLDGVWTPYRTFVDGDGLFDDEVFVGFSVSGAGASVASMYQYGVTFSDYRLTPLTGTVLILQ